MEVFVLLALEFTEPDTPEVIGVFLSYDDAISEINKLVGEVSFNEKIGNFYPHNRVGASCYRIGKSELKGDK
jgi:hypothetical protein